MQEDSDIGDKVRSVHLLLLLTRCRSLLTAADQLTNQLWCTVHRQLVMHQLSPPSSALTDVAA